MLAHLASNGYDYRAAILKLALLLLQVYQAPRVLLGSCLSLSVASVKRFVLYRELHLPVCLNEWSSAKVTVCRLCTFCQ